MNRLKQLWQEQRKIVLLAGVILLLALISLAVNLNSIKRNVGAGGSTATGLETLELTQQELGRLIKEHQAMQQPVSRIQNLRSSCWQPENGNPAVEIRRQVEAAAQAAGIMLKSIGTLQRAKLADGVDSFEMTINGDAQLPEILKFLANLKERGGGYRWKNMTINPDNINAPNYLMLNGTIKVIAVSEDTAKQLWGAGQ